MFDASAFRSRQRDERNATDAGDDVVTVDQDTYEYEDILHSRDGLPRTPRDPIGVKLGDVLPPTPPNPDRDERPERDPLSIGLAVAAVVTGFACTWAGIRVLMAELG